MVVIDGETSRLQACDKEALELQRCLFKEDYDFSACKAYTEALQKCCRTFKVRLRLNSLCHRRSRHHLLCCALQESIHCGYEPKKLPEVSVPPRTDVHRKPL